VYVYQFPRLSGDYNDDGSVTVDELLRAVNLALSGPRAGEDLSWIDHSGDGQVTIDELLVAINNALNGPDAAAIPRSATGAVDLEALMTRAQQPASRRPRHRPRTQHPRRVPARSPSTQS
jgi:hypothetical protein